MIRKDNGFPGIPLGDQGFFEEEEEKSLCINCNELIEDTQMHNHQKKCTEFIEIPKRMNIAAFQEHLNSMILSNPKEQKPVIEMLNRQCNKILLKQTVDLEHLLPMYENSDPLHRCIKRVISFSKMIQQEKLRNFKKSIKNFQASKDEDQLRLNLKLISQMKDHLENKNNRIVTMSTNIDSEGSSYDQSLQEHFYSICLHLKQNIPSNHISQTVPISYLFDLSMQNDVKTEDWHGFILKELANPQNFKLFKKREPRKRDYLFNHRRSIL